MNDITELRGNAFSVFKEAFVSYAVEGCYVEPVRGWIESIADDYLNELDSDESIDPRDISGTSLEDDMRERWNEIIDSSLVYTRDIVDIWSQYWVANDPSEMSDSITGSMIFAIAESADEFYPDWANVLENALDACSDELDTLDAWDELD